MWPRCCASPWSTTAPRRCAIPRRAWRRWTAGVAPIELGQAEIYEWGSDGVIVAFGTLFATCVKAAEKLRKEGLEVGVINARFAKPLDTATLLRAVEELPLVVTVEEGTLEGGFGSAVLEAANAAGLDTRTSIRLGIPDRFIEHGERAELLADLGLDVDGMCRTVRQALEAKAEPNGAAHGVRRAAADDCESAVKA